MRQGVSEGRNPQQPMSPAVLDKLRQFNCRDCTHLSGSHRGLIHECSIKNCDCKAMRVRRKDRQKVEDLYQGVRFTRRKP